MGWTSVHREKSVSTFDFFSKEFNYERETNSGEVIVTRNVGSVVYIAYKTSGPESSRVMAIVCLTSRSNDMYNFSYKDISEEMGPVETDCPKAILDLLTYPAPNEYAEKWREACLRKANSIKTTKINIGDLIKVKEPMEFVFTQSGSIMLEYFRYIGRGKWYAYSEKEHVMRKICTWSVRYPLNKMQTKEFEKITEAT